MKPVGRKIIRLESVDSTNNYTANLAKQGELEHGSVILADEQWAGKGQLGAEWTVKPGENLTMSLFLDDVNLSVESQFFLTKIVSISLCDLMRKFGMDANIKWPNDIYVGNRKIAGVLIENSLRGSFVKHSIIGIGLNVNQEDFGKLNATSLKLETKNHFDLNEVLFSLLFSLNERIKDFGLSEKMSEEYIQQLFRYDVDSIYLDKDGEFTGKIIGVDPRGLLMMEKEGVIVKYDLKEVSFVF
jgi:BirA family biotin operon repressor/biotin-[acetyl-CoA-carboxylase] ligase